jgi:hypothetical protein
MVGQKSVYVDKVSAEPLALDKPPVTKDDARAYYRGGRIPPGKCFVITRIRYRGTAAGDSNGHGSFIVRAGGVEVVKAERNTPVVKENVWAGRVEVRPGEESGVYFQVANSSSGEVVMEGEIIADPKPAKANAGR